MSARKQVANAGEMDWAHQEGGDTFACDRKQLGAAADGRELGCSLFRVPPGKSAFPFHAHTSNEEAVYILRGRARLRRGEATLEVAAGDYIAHPLNGEAHQMINCGEEPLEYLCISTMIQPEVGIYPDSGKFGLIGGSAPGGAQVPGRLVAFYPGDAAVGYWEGE